MKIAVTGASGFVGQHVLAELESWPVETIGLIHHKGAAFADHLRCRKISIDVHCTQPNIFELIGYPDVLIHLAWAGLPHYKSRHHFEQELPAHFQFLKQLIQSGLQNLVVAGTCLEYGMKSGPIHEDLYPQPTTPYGYAKDSLHRQLEYLKMDHPFQLTWTRLFYLYGHGQAESALFPQLKKAVEHGDKVFNMSGGEQLRDYLPVSEVARILVKLALSPGDFGAVNVCSGMPISVRRLVEQWLKENNWDIKLNLGHYPYPDHEPMAFWGNPSKLHNVLRNIT